MALADWPKPTPADLLPLIHDGVVFAGDVSPAYGVHHLALPLFREALRRIAPLIPGGLKTPGCWGYADRPVTGGATPSYHAYGLAIDVNAPDNPYIGPDDWAAGRRSAPHTMPDNTGALVADLGMQWGGDWTGVRDYMHLELHLTPEQAATAGRGYLMDVLDYSSGWPDPATVMAGGFGGVVRYIGTPGRGKNLTRTEAQQMHTAGIPIGLVYEDTAGWMRGGAAAGAAAARAALADAANCGIGVRCVYLACDEDVTDAATMQTVQACLDGAAGTALGRTRTGVYGEADVIDACLSTGHAVWGWQTRAWSGGRISARAHLLQQIGAVTVGGIDCDRSTVLQDDWGQWPDTGGNDVGTVDDITPDATKKITDAAIVAFNIAAQYTHGHQLDDLFARAADIMWARHPSATAAQVQAVAASIASNVKDCGDAIVAAVKAMPTDRMPDDERAALAQDIADRFPQVQAGEVEAALRHVFADAGTPDQPTAG